MTRFALLAAVAAVLPTLAGQARSPEGSSVEGIVYEDISSRPLPRVQISIKKMDAKQPVLAVTDENGRFVITDLVPGVYTLTADRVGYLRAATIYDGKMATQSLTLWRPGQKITGLSIRLKPGAVIAGKVRYRDGDPAIGVPVQAFLQSDVRGKRSYLPAGTSVTNDLGQYRAHSLVPGTYYVVAWTGEGAGAEETPREQPSKAVAISTFYLDGGQLNQATPVRVSSGQEVGGSDIVLDESRTYRVTGRMVSGITGTAVTSPSVSLRWLDGAGVAGIPAVRVEAGRGTFQAASVPPGNYLLIAEGSENGSKLSARQTLTVTDGPITGLEVVAGPVRKWRGEIRFEKRTDYDISSVLVRLSPRSDVSPEVVAKVDPSGAFEAEVVPDETYDVFADNTPVDSYLKSATVDGAESLGAGFRVPRSQDTRHLDLMLSTEGASVSGNVRTAAGSSAPAVLVVMLPQPLDGRLQAVAASLSDENGGFLVRGLPPGRYLAVAWPNDTFCGPFDPSLPPECTAGGQAVRVDRGDVSGVAVVMQR